MTINLGGIEGTVVRTRIVRGRTLYFVSLYGRPHMVVNAEDLDGLSSLIGSSEAIIGCDLNAKHPDWGGTRGNTSGTVLRDWLCNCPGFVLRATEGPSRDVNGSRSYIDYFITTIGIDMQGGSLLETLDYDSDHRAVVLLFSTTELRRAIPREIYGFRSIRVVDLNNTLSECLDGRGLPVDRNGEIHKES